jgi:hypothetical protein
VKSRERPRDFVRLHAFANQKRTDRMPPNPVAGFSLIVSFKADLFRVC